MADLAVKGGLASVARLEDERPGGIPALPGGVRPSGRELAAVPLRRVGVAHPRVRGRHAAVEVENGRCISVAEEVEMEVHAADIGRAGDWFWSSRCAPCRCEQRDS